MTEISNVMEKVYDLTRDSIIVKLKIESGKSVFEVAHVFRQPSVEDWTTYLKTKNFVGLSKGRDTFEFSNIGQEADAEFWETLIQRVEGYLFHGKDLMETSDWKKQLPLNHKLEGMSALCTFTKVDVPIEEKTKAEGFDLSDSISTITFETIFGTERPLITFSFQTPKTEDFIRYNRITSKTQMVRSKQRGTSAIKMPVNIPVFVDLFNSLCLKTEGYKFKGLDWKEEVPILHKQGAIRALFMVSLQTEEGLEQD